MDEVYEAAGTRLKCNVPLKFLPKELFEDNQTPEQFQLEAQAASALDHPNICTVRDIGDHEGQPFIVMRFPEGGSPHTSHRVQTSQDRYPA
jgi:serine/threonine protein kinase